MTFHFKITPHRRFGLRVSIAVLKIRGGRCVIAATRELAPFATSTTHPHCVRAPSPSAFRPKQGEGARAANLFRLCGRLPRSGGRSSFLQGFRLLEMLLQDWQCLGRPVLQLLVVSALRVALEQRDGVFMTADL